MTHDSSTFPDALHADHGPPDPPDTEAPVPGYKNIRVYCDESGIHGAKYIGLGSLWMPHQRRGDFTGLVNQLRQKHSFYGELKWSRLSSKSEAFAAALVTEFFKRNWLMFHALVIRRGYVDLTYHDASRDLALRKHFAMFLSSKIAYFADGERKAFHVIVDPLPSSYKKADEAAHVIIGRTLKRDVGENVIIRSLTTRDSRDTPGIQLADLLLGATLCDWQGEATAQSKRCIARTVAMHLGWPDTHADTYVSESKFNIWHFHDPTAGHSREIRTRPVTLLYPVVPFRPHTRTRR